MKLIIDPRGGIAGDMFAAALISAGANEKEMVEAMSVAANKIGKASIKTVITKDGATRLLMEMAHNHGHLAASKARLLIEELSEELRIEGIYKAFAQNVLEVLIKAENQAHAENTFLTDHHHSHGHSHDHHHNHDHHSHHHHHEEAWLHEAQDIIIDVIGAAKGLQLIGAPTTASLTHPVALGGGRIKFSHGEMDAPAPATKIILDKFGIPSQLGPIEVELCTPTGSAILAALEAKEGEGTMAVESARVAGKSRGGKDLDIPPLGVAVVHSCQ